MEPHEAALRYMKAAYGDADGNMPNPELFTMGDRMLFYIAADDRQAMERTVLEAERRRQVQDARKG